MRISLRSGALRRHPAAAIAAAAVLVPAVALVSLAAPASTLAHGSGARVATDPGGILASWNLDLPIAIPLLAGAAVYLWLVRRVAGGHPGHPWPRRRTASWLIGLGFIALALLSPIDLYSDELLSVHMVQHLLLTTIAPPFLAAGGPGTLLLRAADSGVRVRIVLPVLQSRIAQALTFPLVGWIAFVAVMWGTHFSEVYNLALLDERVHAVEHFAYLFAACLFWWPVFSPDPTRWKMRPAVSLVYVLTQMPQMSFLAVALLNAPNPLYPAYAGRGTPFGIDILADQQVAGGLMWVLGDLAFVVAMGLIVATWLLREEAEAARVDARLDREARLEAYGSATLPTAPDAEPGPSPHPDGPGGPDARPEREAPKDRPSLLEGGSRG
jgi:putative copper resistance protein D